MNRERKWKYLYFYIILYITVEIFFVELVYIYTKYKHQLI